MRVRQHCRTRLTGELATDILPDVGSGALGNPRTTRCLKDGVTRAGAMGGMPRGHILDRFLSLRPSGIGCGRRNRYLC